MAIKTVGVVGAGTMGNGIAQVFAQSGFSVTLVDVGQPNPVPLMTLVEMIRGQSTSAESMRVASELCVRLGKTPVEAADYPGFIANRILMPMINEAIFAVMEGVGTAEAIDSVMKLGMNYPMGPLALADFIGLDV
ncbi:MAG: 3-hydroxybutyryl-CoA dehydrogenase, partial [Acidobacteria bacterium]|nr:3-hydroxybutyryl-CoA dehydrogenase [Acidobacteriota bacterium]